MPKSGNFSPAFLGSLTPAATIGEARAERRLQKTAKNFLKKNIPVEIIAECIGLSLEQVNKIKSKLKQIL